MQLEEQVKVALALGKLRPGDMLPSIRQVEDELGVGRMLVRRPISSCRTRGSCGSFMAAAPSSPVRHAPTGGHRQDRDADSADLSRMRRDGLDPVTFARILHQRLMAEDARVCRAFSASIRATCSRASWASRSSRRSACNVRTDGLAAAAAQPQGVTSDTQVLVDYYYLADVRRLLKGRAGGIYPVALDYDPSFLERVRSLPLGSPVLLLFFESSLKETGTLLAIDALLDRLRDREFEVEVKAVEKVGALAQARAVTLRGDHRQQSRLGRARGDTRAHAVDIRAAGLACEPGITQRSPGSTRDS